MSNGRIVASLVGVGQHITLCQKNKCRAFWRITWWLIVIHGTGGTAQETRVVAIRVLLQQMSRMSDWRSAAEGHRRLGYVIRVKRADLHRLLENVQRFSADRH